MGQDGALVIPSKGGSEDANVARFAEQERALVETVASDDDLLEPRDVGVHGREPAPDDGHALLERLADVPAVEREHAEHPSFLHLPLLTSAARDAGRSEHRFPVKLSASVLSSRTPRGSPKRTRPVLPGRRARIR